MNRKVFLLFFLMLLTSVGCGRKKTYYDSRVNRNTQIVSDNKPTCSINPSYVLVHPQTTPDSITTHRMNLQSNMQVQIIDLQTNPLDFLSTDLATLSFNEKNDNFSLNLSLKNKNGSLTFLVENGEGTPGQCTFGQARGIQEEADLNGDSLVDTLRFLVDDQGQWTSTLFLRTPEGTFNELSLDPQLPLHDPVDQVMIADLNGDSFKDAFIVTKTPEPFVLEFRALVSQSDSSGSVSMNSVTFTGKWEGEPAQGVLSLDTSSSVIKLLGAMSGKIYSSDVSLADKTVSAPVDPAAEALVKKEQSVSNLLKDMYDAHKKTLQTNEEEIERLKTELADLKKTPVEAPHPADVVSPQPEAVAVNKPLSRLTQERVQAQRDSNQANHALKTATQQANTTQKAAVKLEQKAQKEENEAATAKTVATQKGEQAQKLLESVTQKGIPPLPQATQEAKQAQKESQKAQADLKKATQQEVATKKTAQQTEVKAQKEEKQAQQAANKSVVEAEQARLAQEKAAQQTNERKKAQAEKTAKAEEKQAEAARKKAEKEAREAEAARKKAEAARIKAEEAARIKAEKEAEANRKKAEAEEKKRLEAERKAQEKAAKDAEAARKKAEKEAQQAEAARQKAEAARIKAEEAARIKAEKEAEAARKQAELEEKKRIEAERKAQAKAAKKKK